MEYLGLIGAVVLLIWLALRGVDIIFAALACSVLVIATNGLPLADGLIEYFGLGPLGAFTFAGKWGVNANQSGNNLSSFTGVSCRDCLLWDATRDK